jgi:LmbE family N-acetylglucosaminyl deacetylase
MWFSVKAWLRDFVEACERLWSIEFELAGSMNRTRFRWWKPIGGGRVCVIAPHPDDECTGCGGTIVQHQRAGDQVTILQVTDGRAARSMPLNANEMAEMRQQEAHAAVAALGITCLEQLRLPESVWSEARLSAHLKARLAQINPNVVYAPSCVDFHPEHLRVARALAAALDGAHQQLRVRIYEITVPLGWHLANCVADTSSAVDSQDAALAAYHSQRVALSAVTRLRHYRAHYYRVAAGAEVFWEMSPSEYQVLMKNGDWLGEQDWTPNLTPFRNLRERPFTDPIAFWRGGRTRRRLKEIVESK